jgi:hypothetical protein
VLELLGSTIVISILGKNLFEENQNPKEFCKLNGLRIGP